MKLAVLIASVSRKAGGLFTSVRRLTQQLNIGGGVEVHVLAPRDRYTHDDLPEWSPVKPLTFKYTGPYSFAFAPQLLRELSNVRPEVMHNHGLWMYPSLAAVQWVGKAKCPYVVAPHGMLDPWAVQNANWKKRIGAWAYENAHLRRASCLHALCEAEFTAIRQYGLRNPVCVVPNGIDLPESEPDCPPPWKGIVSDGAKVLLYLGRLHPKKNIPTLLNAWASARNAKNASDWHLVVAGWAQGRHDQHLSELIKALGLERSVHLAGPQFGESRLSAFHNASAFILPSFSEGLPMAVLEAWAYSRPVLMTSHCNFPESFDSGAAVQIGTDVDSIARGLADLFAMSDRQRTRIGLRGRKLAEERYSWGTIATEMRSVYEWVLGGGPRPSSVLLS